MQCRQLVSVSPEYKTGKWGFELMLGQEAFTSIPKRLVTGGENYPVIVTGETSFRKCVVIGHFDLSCPEKASGVLTNNNPFRAETTCFAAPVIGLLATGASGEQAPVRSLPEPTLTAKGKQEWLVADRCEREALSFGISVA